MVALIEASWLSKAIYVAVSLGIPDLLRTGESAFQHCYGMDLWQYRSRHSNYAKLFDAAMASFTGTYIDNLLGSYSCSAFRKIIDVGGGDGRLLIGILQKNPGAQGIVYD